MESDKTKIPEVSSKPKDRDELIRVIADSYMKWLQINGIHISRTCPAPLFCTGSVVLQTHTDASDTDLIFFAPPSIKRHWFMRQFVIYLQRTLSIDYYQIREQAFVPLVRLEAHGILFDFLFVNMPNRAFKRFWSTRNRYRFFQEIYSNGWSRKEFLGHLDDASFSSITSLFTSVALLSHPHIKQKEYHWNQFIRRVLCWARERKICANMIGFPSSIAYVLMATYIFLLYKDDQEPDTLFKHFFITFGNWNWEKDSLYCSIKKNLLIFSITPKGKEECKDCMSVSLPELIKRNSRRNFLINTCKNINQSTYPIIKAEFKRAYDAVTEMNFTSLCVPRYFFSDYPYFLQFSFKSILKEVVPFADFLKWQLTYFLKELSMHVEKAEINEECFIVSVSFQTWYCLYVGVQLKSTSLLKDVKDTFMDFRKSLYVRLRKWKSHSLYVRYLEARDPIIAERQIKREKNEKNEV